MILLIILIQLIGVYSIYNTSEKAVLLKDSFSTWFQEYTSLAKLIGSIFLIVSFILIIFIQGLAAGILMGFVLLMTISCLVIILSPLNSEKK